MSGTAPSDSALGGHAQDRGIQQTPLDSNQHGQSQNIIDETKETFGSVVDANVGEAIDAGRNRSGISARADQAVNKSTTSGSGAQGKSEVVTEQGFKVGNDSDLHDLAQSKQP